MFAAEYLSCFAQKLFFFFNFKLIHIGFFVIENKNILKIFFKFVLLFKSNVVLILLGIYVKRKYSMWCTCTCSFLQSWSTLQVPVWFMLSTSNKSITFYNLYWFCCYECNQFSVIIEFNSVRRWALVLASKFSCQFVFSVNDISINSLTSDGTVMQM